MVEFQSNMRNLLLIVSFAKFKNLVLTVFSLIFVFGTVVAQDFRTIQAGLEYAELTKTIDGQPVRMNLLKLDLSKVRIDVIHAGGGVVGTETTSSIARRTNAIAAINAGFFRLDTSAFAGEPAGIFQVDGRLLSEASNGRIALLIDNRLDEAKKPAIAKTRVSMLHLKTFGEFWSREYRFNISGIDRESKENDVVLYSPEFGSISPPASAKITEVVIENKRIKAFTDSNGRTPIPTNGFVLAISGTKKGEFASMLEIGKDALVIVGAFADNGLDSQATGKMAFIDTEDIVGGVPQLIDNGKIDVTWEKEKTTKSFVETRHPRTAVAILANGKFLMITVDGRSESSGGISLYDLAKLLLDLGAVEAMNLDGGGSTTMYLNGELVNHPSDKEGERKVSDALIVTARNSPVIPSRKRH
jgi:hypothetical protein